MGRGQASDVSAEVLRRGGEGLSDLLSGINEADVAGTHLVGYVRGPFVNELEAVLGPHLGPGDKTLAEWGFDTEFGPATIYAWGEDVPLEDVTTWNVGGLNPMVRHEIVEHLRAHGLEVQALTDDVPHISLRPRRRARAALLPAE
jgi:hypothetical protein